MTTYRIEVNACPLYLSVEADSLSAAKRKAREMVKVACAPSEVGGIELGAIEDTENSVDPGAIVYPSFKLKDYGVVDES